MGWLLGRFQPLPATGPESLLETIYCIVLRQWDEERVGRGEQRPVGQLGVAGVVGMPGAGCGVREDVGKVAPK
jgi:hypothetical protein